MTQETKIPAITGAITGQGSLCSICRHQMKHGRPAKREQTECPFYRSCGLGGVKLGISSAGGRIIMRVMKERKKWHEWLNSAGMMVALFLAGVTFYYQFLRPPPREVSAIVLPLTWNKDGTCTVRTVIWNDGARDEVVEGGYLRLRGMFVDKPEGHRRLFGPEVIRPGEAKSLTTVVALDPNTLKETARTLQSMKGPLHVIEEPVTVEFYTIDRSGKLIVSRVWVCDIWFQENNQVRTATRAFRTRVNLLTGKSERAEPEYLLSPVDLLRELDEKTSGAK